MSRGEHAEDFALDKGDTHVIEELTRQNGELCRLVTTLLHRSDEVFASRAWRLGWIVARIERPLRKLLLRDRTPYRHLRPAYFHDLVRASPAFRAATRPPVTGRSDDVPPAYVDTDAQSAVAALWWAAGRELGKG